MYGIYNLNLFKSLRNRVNREREQCRIKYSDSKVSHLKVSDPKQWWKSVNKVLMSHKIFLIFGRGQKVS